MSKNLSSKSRVAGIVCEYNPFHAGHKHQIDLLRSLGYEIIICAMSGNYTERGEFAIADKYTRAEAAVRSGADIVVELPFPFSSLSAEGFALSGVHILAKMGTDTLCFGSETADKSLLLQAARITGSEDFQKAYSEAEKSKGAAKAYFDLFSKYAGEDFSLLSNDILAISYIKAIEKGGYPLNILPIKREGVGYKEISLSTGTYPSAASLRQAVKNAPDGFQALSDGLMPTNALNQMKDAQQANLAPVFSNAVEREILSFFSLLTPQEITARAIMRSDGGQSVCSDGCGLTERLCNSAKSVHTLSEMLSRAYNSRYTDARVNRVMLYALFGVSDHFEKVLPCFTTLLAASRKGCEHLSALRKQDDFSIITKPADRPDCPEKEILLASDDFYTKAMPKMADAGYFTRKHPYIG